VDGDRAIAIELAAESNFVWHVLGYTDEGACLFRAVEPWVDSSTPATVAARLWLSRAKLYPSATRTSAEDALKAADIFRALGDRESLFDALINAASQFNYAGDFVAAERALAEAKILLAPEWPRWTQAAFQLVAGSVKYWSGELAAARLRLRAALEVSRDAGDASQTEWIEMMVVGCDVALHNSCDALRAGREMLARASPPIRGFNRVVTENFVSAALMQMGNLAEAESTLRAAVPRVRRALGTARTTLCYVSLLLARQGRGADAARLLGAVDALRPSGAAILAPPNRACYEDAATIVAQTLGVEEFERLKAEGRVLSEDEAIALGLPGY
jgi:tetratricopeptide (TPR) repeat protein